MRYTRYVIRIYTNHELYIWGTNCATNYKLHMSYTRCNTRWDIRDISFVYIRITNFIYEARTVPRTISCICHALAAMRDGTYERVLITMICTNHILIHISHRGECFHVRDSTRLYIWTCINLDLFIYIFLLIHIFHRDEIYAMRHTNEYMNMCLTNCMNEVSRTVWIWLSRTVCSRRDIRDEIYEWVQITMRYTNNILIRMSHILIWMIHTHSNECIYIHIPIRISHRDERFHVRDSTHSFICVSRTVWMRCLRDSTHSFLCTHMNEWSHIYEWVCLTPWLSYATRSSWRSSCLIYKVRDEWRHVCVCRDERLRWVSWVRASCMCLTSTVRNTLSPIASCAWLDSFVWSITTGDCIANASCVRASYI